ncbi:Tctex1 domain-containing protein 2 [Gryganskiella cystojenkinii]|nr:Tctex1 domain-containing protein 2 [Gryganskiella cystojenkinii]
MQKFKPPVATKFMQQILQNHLLHAVYHGEESQRLSKLIAEEIKTKLIELELGRYKYVVNVVMGENLGEGARMDSRCYWDPESDGSAQAFYSNFYYWPNVILSGPNTVDMYIKPTKEEVFWRGLSNATKFRTSFKIMNHFDRLTEISSLVVTGDLHDVHAGLLPQEERRNDFIKVASFFIKKVCLRSLSRERLLGRGVSGAVTRSDSKISGHRVSSTTAANTEVNAQTAAPGAQIVNNTNAPRAHPSSGPHPATMNNVVSGRPQPPSHTVAAGAGGGGAKRGPPSIALTTPAGPGDSVDR